MITLLIEFGANINHQNCHGWTALHAAISCDQLTVVNLLLESDADCGLKTNEGDTPYDLAIGKREIEKLLQRKQRRVNEMARSENARQRWTLVGRG
jgi:ankyrin repeat protein